MVYKKYKKCHAREIKMHARRRRRSGGAWAPMRARDATRCEARRGDATGAASRRRPSSSVVGSGSARARARARGRVAIACVYAFDAFAFDAFAVRAVARARCVAAYSSAASASGTAARAGALRSIISTPAPSTSAESVANCA